jgi:hypothetical protein
MIAMWRVMPRSWDDSIRAADMVIMSSSRDVGGIGDLCLGGWVQFSLVDVVWSSICSVTIICEEMEILILVDRF